VLRIADTSIELAAMEFGLLQLLVERRRSVTDPELAYVAWHEIADALSFRSVQADSENVRELVHRVRRKLASVQADDLIESKRGVGYRLSGDPG
jgi:DNA-binding response OmpR family regulator